MHINWELLGLGVGFAFIIEGLPYFLFAEKMPPVLLMMATKRPATLRALGLCAILCGLAVVALSR